MGEGGKVFLEPKALLFDIGGHFLRDMRVAASKALDSVKKEGEELQKIPDDDIGGGVLHDLTRHRHREERRERRRQKKAHEASPPHRRGGVGKGDGMENDFFFFSSFLREKNERSNWKN